MSDALSHHYQQGYLVQITESRELLLTIHIYHFGDLTVSLGPGNVIDVGRLEILTSARVLSRRYTEKSASEKAEIQARIAHLRGVYAVVESWGALNRHLIQVLRDNGYSRQSARAEVLSWLGSLRPEQN